MGVFVPIRRQKVNSTGNTSKSIKASFLSLIRLLKNPSKTQRTCESEPMKRDPNDSAAALSPVPPRLQHAVPSDGVESTFAGEFWCEEKPSSLERQRIQTQMGYHMQ